MTSAMEASLETALRAAVAIVTGPLSFDLFLFLSFLSLSTPVNSESSVRGH